MTKPRNWFHALSRKQCVESDASDNETPAEPVDVSPEGVDDGEAYDELAAEDRPAAQAPSRISALVVAAALVVGVAMAPAAVSKASVDNASDQSTPVEQALREPDGIPADGPRNLPIIDPEGPVAAAFPDGVGLDDEASVDRVYQDLMTRVGLSEVSYIWHDPVVAAAVQDSILQAPHWPPAYPYSYPPLEAIIRDSLSEATLLADPQTLVDLASLLMLSPGAEFPSPGITPPAAIAYSLLTVARDIAPTCDIQLNLAFLVSLGSNAPFDGVKAEVERAAQVCGSDPTPLWLLGTLAAEQSTRDVVDSKYSPRELTQHAEEAFALLRERHPTSPLGWTGAADLWLDQADVAEVNGAMPFQVRAWRQQAHDFYEHSRTLSSATGLLAGQARSLGALGQTHEAIENARALTQADPDSGPYQALLINTLIQARDFEGVLSSRAAAPPIRTAPLDVIAVGGPYGFGIRGATRRVYDASHAQTGAGSITDNSFFPEYVKSWVPAGCMEVAEIVSLIATDRASEALSLVGPVEEDGAPVRGLECLFNDGPNTVFLDDLGLRELAAAEAGDVEARDAAIIERNYGYVDWLGLSEHWDARQDFWRWAGDRGRARTVVDEWSADMPDDPWAQERMGEILFLEGRYPESAGSLTRSVDLFQQLPEDWTGHGVIGPEPARQLAQVQLGTALDYANDRIGAQQAWREASQAIEDDVDSELAAASAQAQAGVVALNSGDYRSAVTALTEAAAIRQQYTEVETRSDGVGERAPGGPLKGAELNNLALAAAKSGDHDLATDAAVQAIQRDPSNPVFLDTLAFVHHLAGDEAGAVDAYRAALAEDGSSYVSANNLGVLLAKAGMYEEAEAMLAEAIAAHPYYAKAWHNLGVVRGRSDSPTSFLSSQGALARAAHLDRDLRGDVDTLVVDETIYESGVDVSRPVSADWNYASSATEPARGFELTMLILILLRIGWVLGLDQVSGWLAQKVSASSPRQTAPLAWFWRRIGAVWALIVTVMVLGLPVVWGLPTWTAVFGILVTCVVVATPLAARAAMTRSSQLTHYGWTPAVAVGVVAAPFGISFAPYPVADDSRENHGSAVRWAPSIAMVTVLAVLTLTSVLTSVPYARTGAMMSLVLLASILTPAPPFDGSKITSRLGQLAIAGGLAVVSLAFAMKWI